MRFSEIMRTFARQKQEYAVMNYEELLESRNGSAMQKEEMPFGLLYKKMVDGKYVNVIDLREDLLDSLVFSDALTTESEQNKQLRNNHQLHFELALDSAGLYGVKVEQGGFHTFQRLLDDNPAIVAGKDFITNTIKDLLDLTSYLHDQGIFHICYAPNNVLARKNDNMAVLLFHGSSYQAVNDQQTLYGDAALPFIAPEVISEGIFDARADIYSIGKFMEYLYQQSEVPLELKGVIKKAIDPDPDKRYQSPEDMKRAISSRQNARRSVISLVAALLIAAIGFGVYVSMVPEPEDIEFVKPAKEAVEDDYLDDGFDATTELGIDGSDSLASRVDEKKLREYQAKAEQIFRKRFTRQAEGILSKIYNDDRMGAAAKNFAAGNQATMEELVRAQKKLGNDAGLKDSRSQLIASQIIEQVTNKLKSQMAEREKQKQEE